MKLLDKKFVTGPANQSELQWHHNQIDRSGQIAIYERFRVIDGEQHHTHYEVIIIGSHNGFYVNGNETFIPPAETYPSSNSWGSKGWTYQTKDEAFEKFNELKSKNIMNTNPTSNLESVVESTDETINTVTTTASSNRGRPRKSFEFPTGEFRVKELAEKLHVSVPLVHQKIREAGANVKMVRQESQGRGRAANVYVYQPSPTTTTPLPEAQEEEVEETENSTETTEPVLQEA